MLTHFGIPFSFQVLDDKNVRRRFRASNYQVKKSRPFSL